MNRIIKALSSPRRSTRDLSITIFVTLLLTFIFTMINPNFIAQYNLISIGQNLAPYAMLALGSLIPITMGGIDLSVGAVCIGAATVASKLYTMGMPLWATIPVMIAFGGLIGVINGVLISKYNLQPFIATLGTMMFTRGVTAIFASTAYVLFPTGCWYNDLFSVHNSIPIGFFWIILFAIIIFFVYRRTKLGRYFTSIGSNEKASRISGIDVDKYKIIGYLCAGIMSGIAAIFWSASFATVTVATGNGMELDAIASVYIGGTSAAGGLANVFGSIIGAIMLVIIRSGLNFALAKLNIPVNSTYVTYVISGIVVIVAVLIEKAKTKDSNKSKSVNPYRQAKLRIGYSITSIVLAAFLVVFGITTATNSTEVAVENKEICILMKGEAINFWNSFTSGAELAGEELGYEVICRGPESEDSSFLPQQREIATTLLSENPAGMGFATIANGFTDLLEEAYDRNIPVVQFDSGLYDEDYEYISNSAKNPLVSYIKVSNYNNAALAAEKTFNMVRDDIASSDSYLVGIIQHENSSPASMRSKGFEVRFMELAESDPETKGKCTVVTEVKPSEKNNAYKEALEFLYEKNVNLVFMGSEYVVNQVSDAVQAAGTKYDGIKFTGYDAGEKAVEWIKSDSKSPLLGTMSQNPYLMGYLTVEALVDVAEGKEINEEIYVTGEWYCKENIDNIK